MEKAVSGAAHVLSTIAPAVASQLHANLTAANMHLNLTAPISGEGGGGNHSAGGGGESGHQMVEGGFLTGRNPFVFIPAVPLPTFIIQLLIIVIMSRVVKFLLSPLKQPSVIAEIISGIILGPTAFGYIPHFTEFVFPKASLPFLSLMSNFGLVLFLFLVGLELDPTMLRKSLKKSFAISFAGMLLPFALGSGTSYILYEYIEPEEHRKSFISYLLFLGVAMAITAFPVLARILTELDLLKTKVGGITVSAAAVDDATSWCLLALVVSIINANSGLTAIYVFLMALGYSLFLILIFRPIFVICLRKCGAFDSDQPSQAAVCATLMIVFISAFITDAIGIHAIFGGFIAGIIVPHERGFAYHITEKIEDIVQILFLPLYFALSGLKTRVGTIDDGMAIGVLCLVIAAACIGKIVGCCLAARSTNLSWRESFAVATLMNCKGLVELIVLNLGYDSGVISDKTFAIMVLMALVTTFMTVPIVNLSFPPSMRIEAKPEPKRNKDPTLMVSVNRIEQVGPILGIVNLLQSKLVQDRHGGSRTGSLISSVSGDPQPQLKSSSSFNSLADVINLIPGGKHGASKKHSAGVNINVLRLIELTERDSSVMLSANSEALTNDPITRLIKTFCEVANKHNNVEGLVRVVTMQMFGRVLAQEGELIGARYILVPWSGAGSIVEQPSPSRRISMAIGQARRRHSIHTPAQHSSFLQDLLHEAKSSVVIFVDRGGPVVTADMMKAMGGKEEILVPDVSRKQIYLAFFGGRDDREALEIVMGFKQMSTVKVNVIRYKRARDARNNGEVEMTDNLDEEILQAYFGGRKGSAESGSSTKLGEGEVAAGVNYQEVETDSPVTTATEKLAKLGGLDLIVVGRGNMQMGDRLGVAYGNEDSDRRRVLGDFAEALMLCQCSASILVVAAKTNKRVVGENELNNL